MGRIHLFELEDQKWFPSFLRNYGTDFLQFLSNKTKLYKPIVPILSKFIKDTGFNQIIDLGSGGGGGLIWLNQELSKTNDEVKIMLTDFYPNIAAFEHTQKRTSNIDFLKTSVDARHVSTELKGIRTQFLSLHHFKPIEAKQILQNAVDAEAPIAIFEAQERSLASVVAMLFSPISVLLTTPFIKPFNLGRLLFTYLIPIVPLFVLWDGVVSSLRTYSVEEMNGLVKELNKSDSYIWNIGRIKSGPGVVLYLTGRKN